MIRNSALIATAVVLSALIVACGDDQSSGGGSLSHYFPHRLEAQGLERVSEVRTFEGDSLWEYIDGGAELYHTYGFVTVSTADYRSGDVELVLDLYEFRTADGAYGLYSAFRPDQPDLVKFGVEGYFTGASLEFVRGNIMVRITGYNESEATEAALRGLAEKMAGTIPGTTAPPAMFKLFPAASGVANTDKIIGAGFLGHSFLNMVYTRDYQFGPFRTSLFLVSDPHGAAFADWLQQVTDTDKAAGAALGLPFDERYCLLVSNNYYGNILAGMKNGKLAGVLNYSDFYRSFVSAWLDDISQSSRGVVLQES